MEGALEGMCWVNALSAVVRWCNVYVFLFTNSRPFSPYELSLWSHSSSLLSPLPSPPLPLPSPRIQEPLKWTLLLKGAGAYHLLFEALNSMLARNVLNPADMAMVPKGGGGTPVSVCCV